MVHDEANLNYLIDLIGSDKVALGSDYPFPLGELQPGKLIREFELDLKTKENLLHNSALNWLNMTKEDFI